MSLSAIEALTKEGRAAPPLAKIGSREVLDLAWESFALPILSTLSPHRWKIPLQVDLGYLPSLPPHVGSKIWVFSVDFGVLLHWELFWSMFMYALHVESISYTGRARPTQHRSVSYTRKPSPTRDVQILHRTATVPTQTGHLLHHTGTSWSDINGSYPYQPAHGSYTNHIHMLPHSYTRARREATRALWRSSLSPTLGFESWVLEEWHICRLISMTTWLWALALQIQLLCNFPLAPCSPGSLRQISFHSLH